MKWTFRNRLQVRLGTILTNIYHLGLFFYLMVLALLRWRPYIVLMLLSSTVSAGKPVDNISRVTGAIRNYRKQQDSIKQVQTMPFPCPLALQLRP